MLVAYVFNSDFGANKEGDVVQLDPEQATALVDAGVISEADESHINPEASDGGDEGEMIPEQNAALTRAVSQLSKNLESTIAKTTEAVVSRVVTKTAAPAATYSTPAEVRQPVFKCLGDMARTLFHARKGNGNALRKLNAYEQEVKVKSPLGANEGTNSQGGYFLKPTWYQEVWDKIRDYPKLLERTDRYNITGNTFNINAINETSLADGSRHGGVLGYWLSEAATATSSYPALTTVQAVLNTNVVFVYATNQLLEDANIESFDKKITELAMLELLWQENDAVVNGSGSGQPLGLLNQPALVTVAKSSNDTNAMFGFDDLANMYRALYPASRPNSVFLMNPEAYSILMRQAFVTAGGTATTYPATGLAYNFMDQENPLRIFGRPVIEVLNLPQLGLPGDILLVDLKQLTTAEHSQVYIDVSEHLQFATLQTAFRFYRRYDIRSPWTAALTPKDGKTAYNYSPFVALASRGT